MFSVSKPEISFHAEVLEHNIQYCEKRRLAHFKRKVDHFHAIRDRKPTVCDAEPIRVPHVSQNSIQVSI